MSTDLDRVRTHLAGSGLTSRPDEIARAMRACGIVVTDQSLAATVAALRRDSVGAGRLEPLLRTTGVTDVLVNGPEQVWTDGPDGLRRQQLRFTDDAEVRRLAQRLAASVGRRLDDAAPWVDARLADGTRFHAVLGTVGDPGTCLSLRVPARQGLSLTDWVRCGGIEPVAAEVLRSLVEARVAFLVSGGTGSGKTTLLATALSLVPPTERLVIVEDSRELQPDHPHCIRLEARPPNAEGRGRVTLTELVRQALRMRPDRVIVGEVRGAELCDLLTALNTGHEGGCGTVHANSAADVPARLEALAALGGMGRDALHAQVAAGLQAVVHLQRTRDGLRRVAEIRVLQRDPTTGWVTAVPGLQFRADGSVVRGQAAGIIETWVSP